MEPTLRSSLEQSPTSRSEHPTAEAQRTAASTLMTRKKAGMISPVRGRELRDRRYGER
jgi:hypothetical protein